jgi:hypothetical protein
MDEPTIDPRVNEALQDVSRKTKGQVVCPCCGCDDWDTPSDLLRLLAVRDVDAHVGGWSGEEGAPVWYPLKTLCLSCRNCGFLRSHLIAPE